MATELETAIAKSAMTTKYTAARLGLSEETIDIRMAELDTNDYMHMQVGCFEYEDEHRVAMTNEFVDYWLKQEGKEHFLPDLDAWSRINAEFDNYISVKNIALRSEAIEQLEKENIYT